MLKLCVLIIVVTLTGFACHEESEINHRPYHDIEVELVNRTSREVLQAIHHTFEISEKLSQVLNGYEKKQDQTVELDQSLSMASKFMRSLGEGEIAIQTGRFRHSIHPVLFKSDSKYEITIHIDGYLLGTGRDRQAVVDRVLLSVRSDDVSYDSIILHQDNSSVGHFRLKFVPTMIGKIFNSALGNANEHSQPIEGFLIIEMNDNKISISSEGLRLNGSFVYWMLQDFQASIDSDDGTVMKARGKLISRNDHQPIAIMFENGKIAELGLPGDGR